MLKTGTGRRKPFSASSPNGSASTSVSRAERARGATRIWPPRIRNKRATGRLRDLADLERPEEETKGVGTLSVMPDVSIGIAVTMGASYSDVVTS